MPENRTPPPGRSHRTLDPSDDPPIPTTTRTWASSEGPLPGSSLRARRRRRGHVGKGCPGSFDRASSAWRRALHGGGHAVEKVPRQVRRRAIEKVFQVEVRHAFIMSEAFAREQGSGSSLRSVASWELLLADPGEKPPDVTPTPSPANIEVKWPRVVAERDQTTRRIP